ncbi:MAG: SagB/ThcOx family dehydrogenase [Candidatus Bathyarchaeota archaeon]|nr:SagB/ThcOx family dehydrogenase [Candidatus Bathyarchaeota archaeon]
MRGQGKEFMEKTKYQYLEESDQNKKLPQPPLVLPPSEKGAIIKLPDPSEVKVNSVDLSEAINKRVSVRAYSEKPLTLDELSYVLWSTQGVKQVTTRPATQRTVPSAGARHCFEPYVLVNNVEGVPRGLYRFLAVEHSLQEVDLSGDIGERIMKACLDQRFILKAAMALILTAVRYRMMWRYTERGYRYMHLDAGHVIQNLYLCAEAIDSGVCAIAAFNDDVINEALGVDGEDQFTVYLGVLGKKR